MKTLTLITFMCFFSFLSFSKDNELKDSTRIGTQRVSLNGDYWRIAIDSGNVGIKNAWFKIPPVSASKQTKVPWVIQDIFHDYHGVAWYWREFDTPEMPDKGWEYLLKFHAVDYLAGVWINGNWIGGHEGNEFTFDLNITIVY
ncbi:MAG: sugar-binding domain-containing protein [Segetibacter sp.]